MNGESDDEALGRRTDVLIVDDHALLAQGLTLAFRAQQVSVTTCDELTERAILDAVETHRPLVVLLDLDLGGELGTAVPLIPTLAEHSQVVMLTGVEDRFRLAECVEAGAVGVVGKSLPFDRLVDDVQRVVDGKALLAPTEREQLLEHLRAERERRSVDRAPFERLTPRERQVLAALIEGLSAEEIASDWVVSIWTVRSQIRSLLAKLEVNSQLSAVAAARRVGWEPEET